MCVKEMERVRERVYVTLSGVCAYHVDYKYTMQQIRINYIKLDHVIAYKSENKNQKKRFIAF